MRNKLTNMIKQMANHRDCPDERMGNLINHRLSDRQHGTVDCNADCNADCKCMSDPPGCGGSLDKENMQDCMNNFRDRYANLEEICEGSLSSECSSDANRETISCKRTSTFSRASHMTQSIRLKPDNDEDDRLFGHCAAEGDSNDIYVNYKKNNQIDKQNVNHRSNSTYAHCSLPASMAKRQTSNSSSFQLLTLLTFTLTLTLITAQTSVTFEKLTNRDYSGFTYYTIRNVSLYECLGWCREEQECNAAVFSFIVNPLAPIQDTTCKLLNETYSEKLMRVPSDMNQFGGTKDLVTKTSQIGASKGGGESQMLSEESQVSISLQPQKAANLYFFTKIKLDSESVCNRLWSFERYPNKGLRSAEKESVVTFKSTKEACLTACQAETNFVCRSVEYHYLSNQCHLSQFDRRSSALSNELIDQDGVDYFENSCIESTKICLAQREYDTVRIGMPPNKISYYVEINYYPDKELLVKTQTGCLRACSMENEFICRSILYRANYKPGQPNCALYHLDHFTLPDGLDTFAVKYNAPLPLFDTGDGSDATYLEATCSNTSDMMNTIQQSTQFSQMPMSPVAMSSVNRPTIVSAISTSTLPPTKTSSFGTKQQQTTAQYQEQQTHQNKHILQALDSGVKSSQIPTLTTTFPSYGSSPNTLTSSTKVHQHHPPTSLSPSKTNSIKGGLNLNLMQQQTGAGPLNFVQNITIGTTTPSSCDTYGVCYQVSLRCTDTRITVNVRTSQPFHGRIYALGRSETCNQRIDNLQYFSLEMPLSGEQQCNTQNVQGVYSNTVVLQHHNVVLTKADKVYHVRCTYETTSRNVSFGMVPVRDAVMGSGFGTEPVEVSASPEAPLPRIVIESGEGREANTVRVGDKLTFKIAIPDNTPYGIFARSCHAMAKDARSTFEIIDANGCPVDPSIFPSFQLNGNALESTYEAFRFTESYGVIFQCNIKYCIGRCEPILCPTQTSQQGIFGRDSSGIQSYGRRRRRDLHGDSGDPSDTGYNRLMSTSQSTNNGTRTDRRSRLATKRRQARGRSKDENETLVKHLKNDEMTLSREILVLDINDPEPQRSDLDYTTLNAKELMMLNMDHCASTTSLMALSIISGLLLVLYVCTVAYFTSQQRNYQNRCKSLY